MPEKRFGDDDDDMFAPNYVADRPSRPYPRPISEIPTPVWTPEVPDPAANQSVKEQVDRTVRVLLPIVGLLIIAGIGLYIASLINGAYS